MRGHDQAFLSGIGGIHSRWNGVHNSINTFHGNQGTSMRMGSGSINSIRAAGVENKIMNDSGHAAAVELQVGDQETGEGICH